MGADRRKSRHAHGELRGLTGNFLVNLLDGGVLCVDTDSDVAAEMAMSLTGVASLSATDPVL